MLISLLIILIIIALAYWVVNTLPLPPVVKNIAIVIMVVFVVLWLLSLFPGSPIPGNLL